MLRTLIEEGFDIKERELMRVRAKNRWLLRVPNGTKSTSTIRATTILDLQDGLDVQIDGQGPDEPGMRELECAILVGVAQLPSTFV